MHMKQCQNNNTSMYNLLKCNTGTNFEWKNVVSSSTKKILEQSKIVIILIKSVLSVTFDLHFSF